MTAGEPTPFGKPMLKHWLFDPAYKSLNHGIDAPRHFYLFTSKPSQILIHV